MSSRALDRPTTVLITGAFGMLGYHMRCGLHALEGVELVLAGRPEFADPQKLDALVAEADVVLHFAGVNRGTDAEVENGNVELAAALVASLERSATCPRVVYSSSTHAGRDNAYGRSKRDAGLRLRQWASACGAEFFELVLPHVFGEYGRPFYNSVVQTFCHQLVHAEELRVDNPDGELELLHSRQVVRSIIDYLGLDCATAQPASLDLSAPLRLQGTPYTVGRLAKTLGDQHAQYFEALEVPKLADPLELALFNCLRGAAFPQAYPIGLTVHSDPRGSLFEAVRSCRSGQTFFSTTRPGVTRGNHFHFSKVERFLVVGGRAEIRIRRLFDSKVHCFEVGGDRPVFVDMPTLHTHSITNVGDSELLTLFWAHEFFDPQHPDTHSESVEATPASQLS